MELGLDESQIGTIQIGFCAAEDDALDSIPDEEHFALTWISIPNFFAIGLIFSYLITGFLRKLRRTAVTPCMDSSSALGSQVLRVEPYSGLDVDGV